MKYQLQEREYSRSQIWVACFAMVAIITLLEIGGVLRPARRAGELFSTPFLKAGSNIVALISTPYRIIKANAGAYDRIKFLELSYDQASAQLSEIDNLRLENQELRTLLNSRTTANTSLSGKDQRTAAAILSYGQPQIERSNSDVIHTGSLIFIGSTVIGKVGQVSENFAEALLLSQPTGATLLVRTESGVSGIAQGNGREVVITQLPIQSEVKEGERVVTVGQIGVPADLYIGRVQRIEKKAGEATQKAFIDQGVNFYESRFVEVMGIR
jgi:cell shape-determining protein MreC